MATGMYKYYNKTLLAQWTIHLCFQAYSLTRYLLILRVRQIQTTNNRTQFLFSSPYVQRISYLYTIFAHVLVKPELGL